MLQLSMAGHDPGPLSPTTFGSQIDLHLRLTHRSPATQVSTPPLADAVASTHTPSCGVVPVGAQPMCPMSLVVEPPSISTIHVHFWPAAQPVCVNRLHV